jgi:hypothetical protein
MGLQCSKCGYLVIPEKDAFPTECPNCGVVYAKVNPIETNQSINETEQIRARLKYGQLSHRDTGENRHIQLKYVNDKNPKAKEIEIIKPNISVIKQFLGIVGSIVLFIGVFTPIVSFPVMGNLNYFQNGQGDGAIVLVLAVISLTLALMNKYKGLWFTGIGSLGVLLFTFINFQSKMSQARADMGLKLAGNPFRGLADFAIQSVQLQWGWALLIVGAALIVASAAIKVERP